MPEIKPEKSKNPGGRPTKYQPEYCEAIVEFMGQGYSKTAFAGSIGVSRDTLLEWAKGYPEFSGAVKQGEAARTRFLEMELLSADTGPRVTSRIFALKNACPDEWRDKQEHAHTGASGGPIETRQVSDKDRARALAVFIARTKLESGKP
jgi:hypothetical protein